MKFGKGNLSRRDLLRAAGGATALSLLPRTSVAAEPSRSVVFVFLAGGMNAIFSSADSFVSQNVFGVTASNVADLGAGVVVDKGFADALGPLAMSQMGVVGLNHGQSGHEGAQFSFFMHEGQSAPLLLASQVAQGAPIAAAQIGPNPPPGVHETIGGVSLQRISSLDAILSTFESQGPSDPRRTIAASAVDRAARMKRPEHDTSASTLSSLADAYGTLGTTLRAPRPSVSLASIADAYGVKKGSLTGLTSQLAAAEMMLRVGTKVITIVDDFVWDLHGDYKGETARTLFQTRLAQPLRKFLDRVLADAQLQPLVVLCSEFARSVPGSDHAGVTCANVFGARVAPGTTGRVTADVTLTGSPSYPGFWAYVSEALGVSGTPFGDNPHRALLRA